MPLSPDRRSDDRRRRLLQGEILSGEAAREAAQGEASAETGATGSASATRRKANFLLYAKAADMSEQARVTDLVPKRKLTLLVLFVLGLALVAGMECLYYYMPRIAKLTRDGRVAAFDLDGEGSLAAWFSSATLALAGLAAVLIYTLRRHRLNDYRGRYRIWLWAAACWFVMSIDEAASLHEGFKELMTSLTGNRLYGDGSAWWVMAYGTVLGLVGLVLLWDMRQCWFSALSMLACAACYGTAVATQMQFLLPQRGARGVMVEEGLEMLGDLFLLLAMAAHARFIIRDIQGLNGKKPKKKRKAAPQPTEKAQPKPSTSPAAPLAATMASAKKVPVPEARKPQPAQPAPPQGKMVKDQRGQPVRPQQNRKAA